MVTSKRQHTGIFLIFRYGAPKAKYCYTHEPKLSAIPNQLKSIAKRKQLMDLHATIRREFLKEVKSGLYRELRKAGELEAHCTEKSREAATRKAELMSRGMLDFEAEEIIRKQILQE